MDAYTNSIQDKDIITDYRKDQLSGMEEGHEQSQPRFDVDEPLEVQLRFDLSLVDTQMLLDSHDNRDSHWDFMRQEQSGLAFQAPSEENVALTEHSMKQNDYKSYDNCEQWTRSSVDDVDAHLYMDTQVDVSMISDTFEAKGRDERVGPGGDQDEASTLLDLSAKEHTEKSLDKKIPENDTSFQVDEKIESKFSRNCAADCDEGDTLSKDNDETDACTLKDQAPEEGETTMVMCKASKVEESKSEAVEAGAFTHLETKMATESLVTTNDTANEARVESVRSTSNEAVSVGGRSLEEPYAECLEKQPSMERQTLKSGQKDQAQSFDGLPHWKDTTSEGAITEEHLPNPTGLSRQIGDAVTAREKASVVSSVEGLGFLPGSHLTSSAVGDCAVDQLSGKDLVSKQMPGQIDSSMGNVTANVTGNPESQAASEEVSALSSFEVKNEAEKQKQPVIIDKLTESGKGLPVPVMTTEISLGSKGQMAQVTEHETSLLEGDSCSRHVQMGLLSQSSRADSPQNREGDGSKISSLVKIMNENDIVSSSEESKSLSVMASESVKEKQVSDSRCPPNEVMPRDDPQTIALDTLSHASPSKEQSSIIPAVLKSQSQDCQIDSHLVLKAANETEMTMDEGKLLGHTELAVMDRVASSCQTHTHLTEATTTQQSDSLDTSVDGRCEVSNVASMTSECAELKSSGLSVSESRSCASEFGAAASMEKEKGEAVSLSDLKKEVGESHVSDTPRMLGEALNVANGPADLEIEASVDRLENLRKDMETKTDIQDGDVSDNGKLKTSFDHIVRSGKTPEGAPQLPSGGKLTVDSLDHVGLNDNIAANVEDHNNADSCLEHELSPKAAPAHGNVEEANRLRVANNNNMLSEVQTDNGRLQNSEGSLDADGATNSGKDVKLVEDSSVAVHDGIKDSRLSVHAVLEVSYVKDGSDSGYLQAGKDIPKGNESDPSNPHASPQEEGNKDIQETSIQGTEPRVECKGSQDIDKDITLKPVEEDPSQIATSEEEGKEHARESIIEGAEPRGECKGSENINTDGNEKADEGNPSEVATSVASPTATLPKGELGKSSPNVESNSVRARKNRARQFEVGSNHTDCFQCIQGTDAESPGAPGTKAGHKKKKESTSSAPQSVKAPVKGYDGGALKQKGVHSMAALEVRDSQAPMRQSKSRKKSSVQHSTTISFGQGLEGRDEWGKQVDVQTSKAAYLAPARVPDLNVAEAAISAQPFKESQQVQLRAQILVYGSLIQGGVPEEALMVAAFSDNNAAKRDQGNDSAAQGRVLWEKSWRLAAERINNRGVINPPREPNHSTGASTLRTPDEAIPSIENTAAGPTVSPTDNRNPSVSVTKGHSSRQKHSTEATNKASNSSKTSQPGTSTATRSLPPPSGETVSLQANRQPSDPQIASVRPFFSNPHVGPFVPGTTHWISPTPFPGPWMPQLPHAGFSSSVPFTLGQADLMQEASATRKPASSLSKSLVPPATPVAPGFSSPVMGPSSLPLNTAAADTGLLQKYGSMSNKPTPEARPRKRKKPDSEQQNVQRTGSASTLTWNSFEAANAVGNLSSPPMYSSTETLAMVVANTSAVPAPTFNTFVPPLANARNPTSNTTAEPQQSNRQGGYVLSETLTNHLEQAKANAEEASSLAASAVKESESMWSQLRAETDSGFICDTERQLVSSAIAMKTAAAVAKAAAAAARVAFEAAIQAKMMREEAMKSSEEQYGSHSVGGATESCIQSVSEAGNNLPQAWKMPKVCESALASAKMASKRSIEAASSAMMRAQNLDSVVRAAELATTAVSQVGALVAMGDSVPFKLDTLLEAGCEGLQSLFSPGVSQDKVGHVMQITGKSQRQGNNLEISEKPASNKDESMAKLSSVQEQVHRADQPSEHGTEGPVNDRPKDSGNDSRPDETTRGAEVLGHPDMDGKMPSFQNNEVMPRTDVQKDATIGPAEPAIEHHIVNNSIVEVLSDEEGLRGVWFSARVLKVDEGKALVLYDELISDDGPNRLEEWIGLEAAPGARPRVRLAHPHINVSFEGTRKRRREAIGQYTWSIGDHVDAWIHDGWWEGEIVDTLEEGEGKVKIYFPGEGDTQVIKTSKLRPSLVWKDGKWVLWNDIKESSQKGVESSFEVHKGDTPNAKRQKVENVPLSTDIRKPVAVSTGNDAVDPCSVEEGSEPISSNLTKDASGKVSKVVIGVPKPTKRRKFIEVSKHFTSMKAAGSSLDGKDAVKHDEHAVVGMEFRMGSGETNKADGSKIKKRPPFSVQLKSRKEGESTGIAEARSHVAKKQRDKPGSAESRMVVRKDGPARGAASGSRGSEPKSVKKTPVAGAQLEPQRHIGNNPSSQPKDGTARKTPVVRRNEVTDLDPKMNSKESVKENETPSEPLKGNEDQAGKKTLHKDDGKSISEGCEPRRSVRRIQPTSKLLEGLQTAPKFGKSSFSSRQPLKVSTATKASPSSP